MNVVDHINISSSKFNSLVNATSTYKETGLMFLGEGAINNYVIIDVLNFGFLFFFPIFSSFFDINLKNLVSYFFLFLFFASLLSTLIFCLKKSVNKVKAITLSILILLIYSLIFKYILSTNAEYFIYFFWGMFPLTYYLIHNSNNKIQITYVIILSVLIYLLGSLLYFSYLSFFIFYFLVIYLDKTKYKKKYFYIIPIITFIFLTFSQQYSVKHALNNLNKVENLNIDSNNQPRNIGNNVYIVFYAGLGYLNSDYFEYNFHDDEIYKLVGKNDQEKRSDNSINNATKLTTNDIQLVKEKIFYFVTKKPFFVFKVIFAKIGVLLGYFLIIGNFYLIYFFSSKIKNYYKIPLTINLLISSIIPIISIPSKLYTLTFIGASISIFIVSFCKNKKII